MIKPNTTWDIFEACGILQHLDIFFLAWDYGLWLHAMLIMQLTIVKKEMVIQTYS